MCKLSGAAARTGNLRKKNRKKCNNKARERLIKNKSTFGRKLIQTLIDSICKIVAGSSVVWYYIK